MKFDPFIGSACCPPHSFRPGDLPSCFTLSVSSLRSSCPSCLDNQTNWFQSKQFSGPLNFFALFFQFKTTHPSERTCIKCPFTNVLVPAAFYQLIAHRLLTSMCVHFCLLCFDAVGWATGREPSLKEQETQLSLTNRATRLEVSQGHQTWYHSIC